jgi:hypothetical protein
MHTGKNVRGLAALLALCSLAVTAKAQTMTVSPNAILGGGQTVTITYTNPALAGQVVTIEIAGGFPIPGVETVEIKLDSNGVGTGSWKVNASWRAAGFNAPGVAEVTRFIKG